MWDTLQQYLPQVKTLRLLPFLTGRTPNAGVQDLITLTKAVTQSPVCPGSRVESCSLQIVPNLDTCCINAPSGHFLQTQFWDTSPPLGDNKTWTIHGLWPDYCDGGFEMYCNDTRAKSAGELTRILSDASAEQVSGGTHPGLLHYMATHWLSLDSRNSNLWAHEWNKHGTCISTLEPQCYARGESTEDLSQHVADSDILDYFTHAVLLYTTLPTFEFFARHGIVPSNDETYELEHLQRAIRESSHGRDATIRCRNHNELSEIWYSFHTRGSLRGAMNSWWGDEQWSSWVPANAEDQVSNCPASGIRYVPKADGKHEPPSTTTRVNPTATHTATATVTQTRTPSTRPFTGKGRLMVKDVSNIGLANPKFGSETSGSFAFGTNDDAATSAPIPSPFTGCLIRRGTWYASRSLTSCATFNAHDDVKSASSTSDADPDDSYHLFTLASRYAPCSFVRPDYPVSRSSDSDEILDLETMFFSCSQDLPFQTILSNNVTTEKGSESTARRLTLGTDHQYVFFADSIPKRSEQVRLWTDDGNGERPIKIELYWEEL